LAVKLNGIEFVEGVRIEFVEGVKLNGMCVDAGKLARRDADEGDDSAVDPATDAPKINGVGEPSELVAGELARRESEADEGEEDRTSCPKGALMADVLPKLNESLVYTGGEDTTGPWPL
jgi:hypothetical protein